MLGLFSFRFSTGVTLVGCSLLTLNVHRLLLQQQRHCSHQMCLSGDHLCSFDVGVVVPGDVIVFPLSAAQRSAVEQTETHRPQDSDNSDNSASEGEKAAFSSDVNSDRLTPWRPLLSSAFILV